MNTVTGREGARGGFKEIGKMGLPCLEAAGVDVGDIVGCDVELLAHAVYAA